MQKGLLYGFRLQDQPHRRQNRVNQSHSSIATFEVTINNLKRYLDEQTIARPLHEVEQEILAMVRAIGQAALARYTAGCGTGDVGPVLEGGDVRPRRHGIRTRIYRSLFGPIGIARMYYHEPLNGGVVPLDERLALPERSYSYPLQVLVTRLAATSAYDEGRDTLDTLLGARVPKSMAEAIVAEHGAEVRAFQTALPAPQGEGPVLVIQVDGKGVTMVNPKAKELPGPRIQAKVVRRTGNKKMAVVISIYTIEPEPFCPPDPINRRVYAFIGTRKEAFAWLVAEATKRGYGTKPTLFMSDGDPVLAELQTAMLPLARPCLDWIHCVEYLWDAAHIFHPAGSAEARAWVKTRETRLLAGDVVGVIRGLKQSLTKRKRKFKKWQREALARVIGYLSRNAARMPYRQFFDAGFPIATGSVEGACRHHVADRMEGTGMRWKTPGAQAVLDIRSVHLNKETDEFTAYRIKREQERLYTGHTRDGVAA
jgi:hypothetical protein